MPIARELYTPIFRQYSEHIFSEKLQRIDAILNKYPEASDWVLEDLTYRQLEFHLVDSIAMRAFVHIPDGQKYAAQLYK